MGDNNSVRSKVRGCSDEGWQQGRAVRKEARSQGFSSLSQNPPQSPPCHKQGALLSPSFSDSPSSLSASGVGPGPGPQGHPRVCQQQGAGDDLPGVPPPFPPHHAGVGPGPGPQGHPRVCEQGAGEDLPGAHQRHGWPGMHHDYHYAVCIFDAPQVRARQEGRWGGPVDISDCQNGHFTHRRSGRWTEGVGEGRNGVMGSHGCSIVCIDLDMPCQLCLTVPAAGWL